MDRYFIFALKPPCGKRNRDVFSGFTAVDGPRGLVITPQSKKSRSGRRAGTSGKIVFLRFSLKFRQRVYND